jgi:hypothetical protein
VTAAASGGFTNTPSGTEFKPAWSAIVLLALAFGVFGRGRRTRKRRKDAAGLREEAQARARSTQQAELAAQEHAGAPAASGRRPKSVTRVPAS